MRLFSILLLLMFVLVGNAFADLDANQNNILDDVENHESGVQHGTTSQEQADIGDNNTHRLDTGNSHSLSITDIMALELAAHPEWIFYIYGESVEGTCVGDITPTSATTIALNNLIADVTTAGGDLNNVSWECRESVATVYQFEAEAGLVGVTGANANLTFAGGLFAASDGVIAVSGATAELIKQIIGGGEFAAVDGLIAVSGDNAGLIFKGGVFSAVDGLVSVSGGNADLTAQAGVPDPMTINIRSGTDRVLYVEDAGDGGSPWYISELKAGMCGTTGTLVTTGSPTTQFETYMDYDVGDPWMGVKLPRYFMEFDVSSLPADIVSGEVQLYQTAGLNGGSYQLFMSTATWGGVTATQICAIGSAASNARTAAATATTNYTMNSTLIAAINAARVGDGRVKLALLNYNHDVLNTNPPSALMIRANIWIGGATKLYVSFE